MRVTRLLLVVLMLVSLAPAARACDLCGCPVVIDGTSSFFDQGFSLGVSEQFTRYATLQQDGVVVPNPYSEHLNSSTTQLFLNYNLDNRLGLQLNVPWIQRAWNRREGHHSEAGSASGIGDMSLMAHYLLVHQFSKRNNVTLNLQAGLKFPTGSAGYIAEELTEGDVEPGGHAHPSGIHGHDLAFGSGSVDGVVAAQLFLRQDRFFFATNVQYSLRTRGAYGYRYANDFVWSAGPGLYLDQGAKSDLKLRLNFSGEVKGRDNMNGATSDDTGITTVFVGPQIIGNFGSFYVQGGLDLPIVRDNTALQIMPDYRVNATASYRF